MKRVVCSILFTIAVVMTGVYADETHAPQTLNAEPIAGKPHQYHLGMKFRSVNKVYLRTMLPAESLGRELETIVLPETGWRYDNSSDILEIDRDVDTAVYAVIADGKYSTPITIVLQGKTVPDKIRLVVDGRIGKAGKDFRYDAAKGTIELTSCVTGDEHFMIQYPVGDGVSSISSMNAAELTRELRAHLEWPVEGNAHEVGVGGIRFALNEGRLRSVWMVDFIHKENGYSGKNILTGFTWNKDTNEITLSTPVDTSRYSIYIFGEE